MTNSLTETLRTRAKEIGFDAVGFCPAVTPPGLAHLHRWLESGFAGSMDYFTKRLDAYSDPNRILDGARSIIMLATHYRTHEPAPATPGHGRVARYAWGEGDYHDLIHHRMRTFIQFLEERVPEARARGVVDSAPLMEHSFAQLAGMGWIGKNTLLINRDTGSYFFLAAVLTDIELTYDLPQTTDHCGSCTACLDACPTDAFAEPYVLDARRCISYLTIELREPIPIPLRKPMGEWVFGCDICQEVCPWNRKAPLSSVPEFQPRQDQNPIALAGLFALDDGAFRARFRRTPLWRSKRAGLLRNAAIALANQKATDAIPALSQGLHDKDPIVRGACAWSLRQFSDPRAAALLADRMALETDATVKSELQG